LCFDFRLCRPERLNHYSELLDGVPRTAMQHTMAIGADDGKIDQPRFRCLGQLSQRGSVVALREPVSKLPVDDGKVEVANLADEMPCCGKDGLLLPPDKARVALLEAMQPKERPSLFSFVLAVC
jgi:hypothetical protein